MTATQVFRASIIRAGVIVFLCSIIASGEEPEEAPPEQSLAVLRIEGTHIEHLELANRDGQRQTFDEPGDTVELPPGEYHVYIARLKGGYSCFNYRGDDDWVTVAQGEQAVLKVGAPLEQKVVVKRRGNYLQLDYELNDLGGNAYRDSNRQNMPRFTMFKGEKEIASGAFAYG